MESSVAQILSIREMALAVTSGKTPDEAFEHGKQGDGIPFFCEHRYLACSTLLRHVFGDVLQRAPELCYKDGQREWVTSFFQYQKTWKMPEGNGRGLTDRYYAWLSKRRAWNLSVFNVLLYASLEGPARIPGPPGEYGPERDIVVPATQALALLTLNEIPDQTAGCYELPTVPEVERRFLFFGWRPVK